MYRINSPLTMPAGLCLAAVLLLFTNCNNDKDNSPGPPAAATNTTSSPYTTTTGTGGYPTVTQPPANLGADPCLLTSLASGTVASALPGSLGTPSFTGTPASLGTPSVTGLPGLGSPSVTGLGTTPVAGSIGGIPGVLSTTGNPGACPNNQVPLGNTSGNMISGIFSGLGGLSSLLSLIPGMGAGTAGGNVLSTITSMLPSIAAIFGGFSGGSAPMAGGGLGTTNQFGQVVSPTPQVAPLQQIVPTTIQ